jgi:hypothetical protein
VGQELNLAPWWSKFCGRRFTSRTVWNNGEEVTKDTTQEESKRGPMSFLKDKSILHIQIGPLSLEGLSRVWEAENRHAKGDCSVPQVRTTATKTQPGVGVLPWGCSCRRHPERGWAQGPSRARLCFHSWFDGYYLVGLYYT